MTEMFLVSIKFWGRGEGRKETVLSFVYFGRVFLEPWRQLMCIAQRTRAWLRQCLPADGAVWGC